MHCPSNSCLWNQKQQFSMTILRSSSKYWSKSSDLEDIDAISSIWNVPKSKLCPQVKVPKPVLGGAISLEETFCGCLNSNSGVL